MIQCLMISLALADILIFARCGCSKLFERQSTQPAESRLAIYSSDVLAVMVPLKIYFHNMIKESE